MTEEIMDAILAALQAYDWDGTAPASYHFGPIPATAVTPAIGILPGEQTSADKPLVSEAEETFTIGIASEFDPADAEAHIRAALGIREEIKGIIWDAVSWGIPGVEISSYRGSSTNLGLLEGGNYVMEITITLAVTYRDDF